MATALYSENQVATALDQIGVSVVGDTTTDFLCLCPFHGNTNTPAFSVSKDSGKFLCFNAACGESGTLIEIVKRQSPEHKTDFQAARLIARAKQEQVKSFEDRWKEVYGQKEMPSFDNETAVRLSEGLWENKEAKEYMLGRGFTEETLRSYRIGYSVKKNVISVPMYDIKGSLVGFVGRRIDRKAFDNSKKIPVRQTLWNIHRAIRTGSDTVVICEATFDAMLISQAGYPNVVACLGGNFNANHEEQIKRYFNNVVIFTDWDNTKEHMYDKPSEGKRCSKCRLDGYTACKGHNPGRDTGNKIASAIRGKGVKWASYDYGMVFPIGVKDAGDMDMQQIRQCVQNAVSNHEYQIWNYYYQPDYEKSLTTRV